VGDGQRRHPYLFGHGDGFDYYGPDGNVSFFAWNAAKAAYITPPGIDATLCASWANGNCRPPADSSHYLLEFRDG
jgi:hypothetical protein